MESCLVYNFSEESDFNLNFIVDIGRTNWYDANLNECELTKDLRSQLPIEKMFKINSLIFNLEKHQKEILSKYDCYYNEKQNSFTLIINEDTQYKDFTKEIMMNMLKFVQIVGIDKIYILLSKKNQHYVRLLQALLTVGFENDKIQKIIENKDSVFKILKMTIEEENSDEIEEVTF